MNKVLNIISNFKHKFLRDKKSRVFLTIEFMELFVSLLGIVLSLYQIASGLDVLLEILVTISSIAISFLLFYYHKYVDLISLFRYSFALGIAGFLVTSAFMVFFAMQ